jgi:hypothetical protein
VFDVASCRNGFVGRPFTPAVVWYFYHHLIFLLSCLFLVTKRGCLLEGEPLILLDGLIYHRRGCGYLLRGRSKELLVGTHSIEVGFDCRALHSSHLVATQASGHNCTLEFS